MRRISTFLFIVFAYLMSCPAQDLNKLLNQLDMAVHNRNEYVQQKEERISKARKALEKAKTSDKFRLSVQMFANFYGFDTDSARYYSDQCYRLALAENDIDHIQLSEIFKARCFAVNGMFEEAEGLLFPLKGHIVPAHKLYYYYAMNDFFNWKGDYSLVPTIQKELHEQSRLFRDSIVSMETKHVWKIQIKAQLLTQDSIMEAKRMILSVIDTLSVEDNNMRYVANTAAAIYERLGMQDSTKYYYALSALSDIENAIREHSSLRKLALILFKEGEVNRAYDYMNCCLEDAAFCKARLRTLETAQDMPVIMEAYQQKLHAQQTNLLITALILAALLLLTIFSFARIYRITIHLRNARKATVQANEDLKCSNEQLEIMIKKEQTINQQLTDSNQIKETYVAKYMTECSNNIEKIDSYRKSLQRIARNEKIEDLLFAIRATDLIEKELEAFYKGFDETFLGLYPSFVKEFNNLLQEDEQLENNTKGLTTELRIFALIRLGITDSNEIATFLRYSVKTIYNYRTKIRNKAKGSREELEEKVKKIGISKLE